MVAAVCGAAALAVGAAAVLSTVAHRHLEHQVAEDFSSDQQTLAKQMAANIESTIGEIQSTLGLAAGFEDIQQTDQVVTPRTMVNIHQKLRGFGDVIIRDDGQTTYVIPAQQHARYASPSHTWRRHVEAGSVGASRIEGPFTDEDGTLYLLAWEPVYATVWREGDEGPSNESVGVLAAIVRIATIADAFVAPLDLRRTGHAWIMDPTGTIVSDPVVPEAVGLGPEDLVDGERYPDTLDLLEMMTSGLVGSAEAYMPVRPGSERYQRALLAFAPVTVGDGDWAVAVTIPYSEVTSAVRRAERGAWLLTGVVFLITAVAAVLLVVMLRSRFRNEERAKTEALRQITVTMGHEINNPLAAVMGQARLLLSDLSRPAVRQMYETEGLLGVHGEEIGRIKLMQRESMRVAKVIEWLKEMREDGKYETEEYLKGVRMIRVAELPLEEAPLPEGLRILVADDKEEIRQTLDTLLSQAGCTVMAVDNGLDAVRLAQSQNFDVVLTDIRMPGKTGYEVFTEIHKAKPDMPIIMMTGYGYDEAHCIVRAKQEGLANTLYKPFEFDQLRRALVESLSSRRRQAEAAAA